MGSSMTTPSTLPFIGILVKFSVGAILAGFVVLRDLRSRPRTALVAVVAVPPRPKR